MKTTRRRTSFILAGSISALLSVHSAQAIMVSNTEDDVLNGSTDLTDPASYNNGAPGTTSDVTFTAQSYSPATFTVPTNLSIGTLDDLATNALTITGGGNSTTLTLNGGANSVAGADPADLIYVKTSNFTIGAASPTMGLALAASGNFDIAAGTTTINSVISDSGGGFTKTGAGKLVLANSGNTYTGPTAITGGALSIAAEANLGAAPASYVANQLTLDGGTLQLSGNTSTQNWSANRGIYIGAGGGAITTPGNDVQHVNFQEIISGPGTLTLSPRGTGTRAFILSGANTFGGLIIAQNEVDAANSSALGAGSVQLGTTNSNNNTTIYITANGANITNNITVTPGGTRTLGINSSGGTSTFSGPISLTGGTVNPTLNLAQLNNNSTLNLTGGITGTGNVAFAGGIGTRNNANITISGADVNNVGTISNLDSVSSGTNTISANIGSNVTGIIQNTTHSPLVVSGANTAFAGTTTVTLGTLSTSSAGTLGSGNVAVADTAGAILTLQNTASIGSSAILSFGTNSAINMNFTGDDTLAGITDTTTSQMLAPGTYTADQLNTFFGVSSFATTNGDPTTATFSVVPEANTWALMLGGFGTLVVFQRIRRRSSQRV